ncbi:MAG: cytochrome c3 family protein [Acidobacteria bacterium]|nr:cytochrome c3 family protein [Acidobacteriota bacterium]
MKKLATVLLSVLVIMLFATGALAVKANAAPAKITVDAAAKKQPAVTFDHAAHGKLTKCETCHHTQKGLAGTSADEVKKCSSCHLTPEKAETPKISEMSMTKNPYHISCIKCHKDSKNAKAPTKCVDCHKK